MSKCKNKENYPEIIPVTPSYLKHCPFLSGALTSPSRTNRFLHMKFHLNMEEFIMYVIQVHGHNAVFCHFDKGEQLL